MYRLNMLSLLLFTVLSGMPICEQDRGRAALDQALFEQWQHDLRAAAPERHAIVLIEIEARLRRQALNVAAPDANRPSGPGAGGEIKIEQLARLIAERYADPLRVGELAAAVGLHPHYAMQLFRKTFGMSLPSAC